MKHFVIRNGICTIIYEFPIFGPIHLNKYIVVCGSCLCNEEKQYNDLFEALIYASNHICNYDLHVTMVASICFCQACHEEFKDDF